MFRACTPCRNTLGSFPWLLHSTDSAQCNLFLPSSTYISPSLSKLVPEPSSLPPSPQPPPSPPPPLVPSCPVPPATSQPTVPPFPPQPGSPTSHAVSNSHYALGNGGVSNCSIGIVSGEDIDLRKSHETVAKRKRFLPEHLQLICPPSASLCFCALRFAAWIEVRE
jgi:hypothetical protein